MKANLSQKAMKFTEELVDISWVELKLLISNWKRFDFYFPLLKPKNWARFLLLKPKHESMKVNLSQKALKLASNDNWGIELKLFISNWKRFDLDF